MLRGKRRTLPKPRVGILISGRGSNMQALVEAAANPDMTYQVALVASDNPAAPGIAWAAERALPVFALAAKGLSKAEHEAGIDAALREARVDYVALAGYMRILSAEFVGKWEGRILNIHPSLLPKYKGLDTHARAIEAGDKIAGCSVHVVTPELDSGEVLGRAVVPILAGDTVDALGARVLAAEHRLYPRLLAEYVSR